MTLRQFYDWQTAGGSTGVARLAQTLEAREIPWCMIARSPMPWQVPHFLPEPDPE